MPTTILSALLCLSLTLWWLPGSAEETETEPLAVLPDPAAIEAADTVETGGSVLKLLNCANRETISGKVNIVCYCTLTQDDRDFREYTVKRKWDPRLIDNFYIEHEFIALYFINRRGQQQDEVRLAKGDMYGLRLSSIMAGKKTLSTRTLYSQIFPAIQSSTAL
jgi:hypothetical protein